MTRGDGEVKLLSRPQGTRGSARRRKVSYLERDRDRGNNDG